MVQDFHHTVHIVPLSSKHSNQGRPWTRRNKPEAQFRWSRDVPDALIVFVHGFNSSALGAWCDFDKLLPVDPDFKQTDICFFQYDGNRCQVLSSAAVFRKFLLNVIRDATCMAGNGGHKRRDVPTAYRRLIIVAHSTGAVVVRKALADIVHTPTEAAIFNEIHCSTLMFGPEYCGAKLSEIICALITGKPGNSVILRSIASYFVTITHPVISDLGPDSKVLKNLHTKVEGLLLKNNRRDLLTPTRVTIGMDDNVIFFPDWYNEDPPTNSLPDYDHISICKPKIFSDERYQELKIICSGRV
ncbi:MAG: hypothetical protein JWP80_4766 [Pseudomonas sp.]|nr:hypothetical protein [Pseudomonas sp.]